MGYNPKYAPKRTCVISNYCGSSVGGVIKSTTLLRGTPNAWGQCCALCLEATGCTGWTIVYVQEDLTGQWGTKKRGSDVPATTCRLHTSAGEWMMDECPEAAAPGAAKWTDCMTGGVVAVADL